MNFKMSLLPQVKAKVRYYSRQEEYSEIFVEVLTLHLKTGTMRVRYQNQNGQIKTEDIPNLAFFEQYEIKKIDKKE